METEEIKQMISKKVAVVKESFISLFEIFTDAFPLDQYEDEFDEYTLAVLSYNATILMMEKILNYSDYFERECHITERNRKRMLKDMKTMKLLDYPNSHFDHDYVKNVVDNICRNAK